MTWEKHPKPHVLTSKQKLLCTYQFLSIFYKNWFQTGFLTVVANLQFESNQFRNRSSIHILSYVHQKESWMNLLSRQWVSILFWPSFNLFCFIVLDSIMIMTYLQSFIFKQIWFYRFSLERNVFSNNISQIFGKK